MTPLTDEQKENLRQILRKAFGYMECDRKQALKVDDIETATRIANNGAIVESYFEKCGALKPPLPTPQTDTPLP